MVIFNTTYAVSDQVYGSFIKWLKEIHLPRMINEDAFSSPVVSRIINAQPDQEGTSVSVQLKAPTLDYIAVWNEQKGDEYRAELKKLFDDDVLFFATFMEEI